MRRATANLMLLTSAAIWGSAFVPQAIAMRHLDPFWFTGLRFLLSALLLLPFALAERRREAVPIPRKTWPVIALVSLVMMSSSIIQQFAMKTTSATNAGFLTSLYVLFTPIVGYLVYRERPRGIVWVGALVGLGGTWLLSGGVHGFGHGDGLIVVTAMGWALLIVLIGRLVQTVGHPVGLAFVQNLATAVGAIALALPLAPLSIEAVQAAFWPIVLTGFLSGGIAYTFQAIGQRHTRATDAAIILSAEAPFAALTGAIVLGERLTTAGFMGCVLIFGAILLVQLWPSAPRSRTAEA
ncbi:DMT family transporter [Prosthecomicrobium sp. N25]|uniref:DMT family transporter n=1 Tax=Prosthecomicrobium sp. N25 TaxID=3129254 RepID=UPI00307750DA